MGQFILKTERDEDRYVVWSTVVDGPVTGPFVRADAIEVQVELGAWDDFAAALDRADETGTSTRVPGYGQWDDTGLICRWDYSGDEEVPAFWIPRDRLGDWLRGHYVGEPLKEDRWT